MRNDERGGACTSDDDDMSECGVKEEVVVSMMSSSMMKDEKTLMRSPDVCISSESTSERVSEREGGVVDRETWEEVSSLELRYLHSAFNNKRLVMFAQVCYGMVAYHHTNIICCERC